MKLNDKNRLIIVSNRLPVSVYKEHNGLIFKKSVGGLTTGLESFYEDKKSIWIGWSGIEPGKIKGKKETVEKKLQSLNCYPIFLTKKEIQEYYDGFCNKTIWPLFHYFPQFAVYDSYLWKYYKKVNEIFAEKLLKIYQPNDLIWMHDYQLMLLPQIIRKKIPDAAIGFFLHIPFPSFEVFRLLPWRSQIINGLLGADLVGFHTYDYARYFQNSADVLFNYSTHLNQIITKNRIIKSDVFPMGIDFQKYSQAAKNSEIKKEAENIKKKTGGRSIILSVDRLDYTKGILKRLEAFDYFLKENPQFRYKVSLIIVAVPSRTQVGLYKKFKKQIDEMVGRINGKYGSIRWMPIWYLYQSLSFRNLSAMYLASDIALITPLRDGMNLIAKEYSAVNKQGTLILSEMTGASKELAEALIVNPNDKEDISRAMEKALKLSEEEKLAANRTIRKRLKRYNVHRWAKDFIDSLVNVKRQQQKFYLRKLNHSARKNLIESYKKSRKRLILLDYDGTLIPFYPDLDMAKPDKTLLNLIGKLSLDHKNKIVIISGRKKDTLEKWFSDLNADLIAEHGIWIKNNRKKWHTLTEDVSENWKKVITPILELYTDRTPGAFIEEKDFSLVWHYRKADPKLVSVRVNTLKEEIKHLMTNLHLDLLEGNKIIEVKTAGIDKGKAIHQYIEDKKSWDFLMAAGDDVTDEDIFTKVPKSSFTIKVGVSPSQAKYLLNSYIEVRELLYELSEY